MFFLHHVQGGEDDDRCTDEGEGVWQLGEEDKAEQGDILRAADEAGFTQSESLDADALAQCGDEGHDDEQDKAEIV